MRIAVVAHVRHPIAPPFRGGMEAHSWHLADALARRGHAVTLMASGDSAPPPGVTVLPSFAEHYDQRFPWHDYHGSQVLNDHVDDGFAGVCRALLDGNFDIVHNNSLHRYPPRLARACRLPMVTSLHVPPFDALRRAVHESAAAWCRFTVPSRRQADVWWPMGAPEAAHVVPNGIAPDLWPFRDTGDGSAVWSGRITPTKGTHFAVQAALMARVPLTLYGTIEHRDYFEETVRPFLGPDIRYGGHLEGAALAAAIGAASVLLFTPLWEEPFGLAAVEAMATGVPVAAIDMGAVREVIGEAGTYAQADDVSGLANALRAAMAIPRRTVRDRVLRLYTTDRMIAGYEEAYAMARAGRSAFRADRTFPPIELRIAPRTATLAVVGLPQ